MKTVLIYSGGLDSSCLLFDLLKQEHEVECLNFQYGSKHNENEAKAAKLIADQAMVKVTTIPLLFMGTLFNSTLLKSGAEIPHGNYDSDNMKATVVPFRNAIMLSIAGGYAASIGADNIAAGIHAGDHTIYPDCRVEFFDAFNDLLRVGLWEHVKFLAPYAWLDKGDVAIKGYEAGAPVFETYSCYEGGEQHCGLCGACNERKEAFQKLFKEKGVKDATTYKA
jgi:7-cyano-7-deazaguanine synthase